MFGGSPNTSSLTLNSPCLQRGLARSAFVMRKENFDGDKIAFLIHPGYSKGITL
jgi:hypothetical protein